MQIRYVPRLMGTTWRLYDRERACFPVIRQEIPVDVPRQFDTEADVLDFVALHLAGKNTTSQKSLPAEPVEFATRTPRARPKPADALDAVTIAQGILAK